MQSRRTAIRHIVSISLALAAGSLSANALAQASREPIKLGFLSSFTGPASQSGFNGIAGVKLAIKEINANGGILGRQVEVIQGDDQSDPTAAVTEMRRLVQREKVDAMIGPIASQITLATIPVLNEAKMPSISVTGSGAMTPQVGPYHFSMLPSAGTQAEAIATYLEQSLHAKSAGVIHDAGAQTVSTVEALKNEASKRGITLTNVQQYELTATDMTPNLLTLRRSNPEYLIVLTGTGSDTGYILKNLDEIGWNVKVVGNNTVVAQVVNTVKIAGPNAYKNAVAVNYKAVTFCTNDPAGGSDYAKLGARLQAFDSANYPRYALPVVAYIYDSVYAMKAGLEGAGKIDGPAFAAWMEANAGKLKGVLSAPLVASKTSHFLISPAALVMVENPTQTRDGLMKRVGC
jgi:ABC-type branched-subunit amino acid transport system substrate-binding protein